MAASISDMQNKLRAVGAYNPHASDRSAVFESL